LFRERISCSLLSRRDIKISSIRSRDDAPGLRDYEASFLRLVEQLTDGSYIEINETGTTLRFKPGILVGSSGRKITHDCGVSRCIGWFIEGILPMAIFSKTPVELTLLGITNDSLDLSVDLLRDVTIPLLQNFGIWGIQMKVVRRGCAPKGGGAVEISIPCTKGSLKSIQLVEEGLIKRIRGVAFCSKISPNIVMRVIGTCRQVLNNLLPDVHIGTDHFKGREGGSSPGYSITLVAESTSGVLLSVERTAMSRTQQSATSTAPAVAASHWTSGDSAMKIPGGEPSSELPEDVGQQAAMMLMREIQLGRHRAYSNIHPLYSEQYSSIAPLHIFSLILCRWLYRQHAPAAHLAADGRHS